MSKEKKFRKITRGTLHILLPGKSRRVRIKHKQDIVTTEEALGKWIVEFEEIGMKRRADPQVPKGTEVPPIPEEPTAEGSTEEEAEEDVIEDETYLVKHVGGGRYNVLSSSGKVMNENRLSRDDAEALRESLSS